MSTLRSIVINQEKTDDIYEIYLLEPTRYILNNYSQLFASWGKSPHSLIIVLLYSTIPLNNNCARVRREKNRLKENFLRLGKTIQLTLQKKQFLIEIIDPQDGKPLFSNSDQIFLDSVAVVHKSLMMHYISFGKCKLLHHPFQKTSIYPGLMITNAKTERIRDLITAKIVSDSK